MSIQTKTELWKTIEEILSVPVKRKLSLSSKGTPIVWDLPFRGDKGIERVIEILDHPDVVAALKAGLKLSKSQVFIWVSQSGELDYGLVQGDYFITLWVSPSKFKDISEARNQVLKLAKKKLQMKRRHIEQTIKILSSFGITSREERISSLRKLKKDIHPLWEDLRKKVQELLEVEIAALGKFPS